MHTEGELCYSTGGEVQFLDVCDDVRWVAFLQWFMSAGQGYDLSGLSSAAGNYLHFHFNLPASITTLKLPQPLNNPSSSHHIT
jgi:hypothetical protein